MAYVFTGPFSVRDEETGIELSYSSSIRDGIDTFDYTLKDHGVQFQFKVVFSHVSYPHIKDDGNTTTRLVNDAVYILEDSFRSGLGFAYRERRKDTPQEKDYEHYKKIVTAGFEFLVTKGGKTLKHIPSGKLQVLFVENLRTLAAEHPGVLKCFKLT